MRKIGLADIRVGTAATVFCVLLFSAAIPADAHFVPFKEQFYRLFRMHLQRDPDNFIENIYWLERALQADFANPLHAIARIETEIQWEKYRYLFMMHLNVKMVEQYLFLGSMWSRRQAFFFNAPWKSQNLESLEIAETTFLAAMYYWDAAQRWAELARHRRFRFVELPRVQFWVDSAYRIEIGELNYGRTIRRELANIERMREQFRAMPDPIPWPDLHPPPAFPW
ncbi:MAG: hypothetical protein FWD88_00460 [Treponema sp.]|nr:hypothetical protein [Treponema sp.]